MLKQILDERQQLEQQRIEVDEKLKTIGEVEATSESASVANFKKTSPIYAEMPPENAAAILLKYIDGGDTETPVRILDSLTPRIAADIPACHRRCGDRCPADGAAAKDEAARACKPPQTMIIS